MSELCLSATPKSEFPSLLLSDFFLFCSFILSHPLYFLYFIFFSPYLLKFLSFLSPLFITTSLLLLTLLTIIDGRHPAAKVLSEPKLSFLLSTCHTVVEKLRWKIDDEDDAELCNFEDFQVYKIMFDTSDFDAGRNPVEASELKPEENGGDGSVPKCSTDVLSGMIMSEEEKPVGGVAQKETVTVTTTNYAHEKSLESFFKELDSFDKILDCKVEEKKIEPSFAKPNKVVVGELQKQESLTGSEAMGGIKIMENIVKSGTDNLGEHTSTAHFKKVGANVNNIDNSGEYTLNSVSSGRLTSSFGSYGSMRKEKEWKRTLACKLFEERHNVGGEEGMDSLWEAYEAGSIRVKEKNKNIKKKDSYKKKGDQENEDDDDDDDDEEEELSNGQLCCLQALKFSAGKMNLGMGRPNLVRITKALKGIGWLHHSTRHGKKRL